ncbi:YcaO-like family protein [Helicobacter pylori]|uniref:YcaO-like family protein n=1 Tax=Helicobacter pylori TaxID=210 RepID=UPI001ABB7850|nr:YcaO-like family protein [Helicobacter pylori]
MLKICELLDLLLDFECGLITYITEIPTQHLEPLIQIYVAEFQNPCSLTSNDRVMPITNRQVSGAGLTKEEALLATIGEALERYSISQSAHINSIYDYPSNLYGAKEFLETFILFSEHDYKKKTAPFKKPNLNNPIHFVAAKNLSTGQEHFVPRSLVFMDDEGCNRFDKTYSTGTACHIDREKAIFSSLCELIERDVYACYWLCGITPLRLNNCFVLSQLPNEFSEEILRTGLSIKTFALMNQFEIPVIACIITAKDGGIATGCSCHTNVKQALKKAMIEAFHTFNWCLEMKRSKLEIKKITDIDNFKDHVSWYLRLDRSSQYLWHTQQSYELLDFPTEWSNISDNNNTETLIQKLVKNQFIPLAIDVAMPDVKSLGFEIIRCMASGLQPLYAGQSFIHTNKRRLSCFFNFLQKKSLEHSEYQFLHIGSRLNLNRNPHCFP